MNDNQKRMLIQAVLTAVVTLLFAVAAIFGYNIVAPAPPAGQVGAESLGQIHFTSPVDFQRAVKFDASAPETHAGTESHSGAVTFTGAVAATVVSVAGTPVTWATPIPTAVNLTYYGATPKAARVICDSVSVTGLATGTPIAPITTPFAVWAGLAQSATGDGLNVDASHASGVVTIHVWNSALTPAAATTPAAVTLCEMGN